jgi:S1-C subfamily serine protease
MNLKNWLPGVLSALLLLLGVPDPALGQGFRSIEDLLGLQGLAVAQVLKVVPGMPAQAAGIRTGDLVTAFDGHTLREFYDYRSFLDSLRLTAYERGVTLELLRYDSQSGDYLPLRLSLRIESPSTDPNRRYVGIGCQFNYFVLGVSEAGVGARLGLERGDFVEEFNGREFEGILELERVLNELASGENPEIRLWVTRWRPVENGKIQGSNARVLFGRL